MYKHGCGRNLAESSLNPRSGSWKKEAQRGVEEGEEEEKRSSKISWDKRSLLFVPEAHFTLPFFFFTDPSGAQDGLSSCIQKTQLDSCLYKLWLWKMRSLLGKKGHKLMQKLPRQGIAPASMFVKKN
ncbi:unnamed protein product [Protopolystoma xenopodis]|uniref:Uncharacterized protein n=1 Tax=Protopolystoma xenopodis TaxID=117903 RepID=A0A3S5CC33_9PLAT|nr:unnamed protein product [Protopolystoma xenopodis]